MHGADRVAKIAASMARFGWTVPCMVVDDGERIAGYGRVLAAAMAGPGELGLSLPYLYVAACARSNCKK